jgi:DNA-binding HxlR family transcriptional regulator
MMRIAVSNRNQVPLGNKVREGLIMEQSRISASGHLCENLTEEEELVVRDIVARVADKWSLWALSELFENGPLRFSRLLERIEGISQKSLTATLRQLERDGLVTRTVTVQVPIRVDYEATDLGLDLIGRFEPFWLWVADNRNAFAEARKDYDSARL